MASIRQIRNRIRSVKNIQQITRAMKMVSSARLRKAQHQLLEARPYALQLRGMIQDIAARTGEVAHPLLAVPAVPAEALVVMTSDRGLCAGFNAQVLQRAGRWLQSGERQTPGDVLVLGRKGLDFFRRIGHKAFREWAGFWQELNWQHANLVGQEIIDAYSTGRWRSVTLVYNRFKSIMTQEAVQEPLLPLASQDVGQQPTVALHRYEFEPEAEAIYARLLPSYVKNRIWHALLESKAAELAARMAAMENATKSANDMIGEMVLHMNRARQAAITREISELVSSAEAINA